MKYKILAVIGFGLMSLQAWACDGDKDQASGRTPQSTVQKASTQNTGAKANTDDSETADQTEAAHQFPMKMNRF